MEIIVEVMISQKDYEMIEKTKMPIENVRRRYLQVDFSCVQYIEETFDETTRNNEIRNIK